MESNNQTLATKEDMLKLRSDLQISISATKEDIAKAKVEMIKWMFAFWVTLALMIIGLYFKK